MAIVKPEEMNFSSKNIIMIISGLPGVGKTTLALSAPNVVVFDVDEGMSRVRPEHRKDSSMTKKYEELQADADACIGKYETVVIDTCGALITMLKEWAARTDKSVYTKNGNVDVRKIFGVVKSEFLSFSSKLRQSFNVVYIFHAEKDRADDEIFYDIVCEGSAKTLVWQPADLGAYLHINNGKRYLGFTPTMNYSAKSAYGIKGLVEVPELPEGVPNDFLTRLFAQVRKNLDTEAKALKPQTDAYNEAMKIGADIVNKVEKPEQVKPAIEAIKKLKHGLTSEKELMHTLKIRIAEINIVYSKERKAYEYETRTTDTTE